MKTTANIRQYIDNAPFGQPFVSTDFLQFGTRASIDQTLSRLVKEKTITRIARGVFIKPKQNSYVGSVMPNPYEIAQVIAKATGSLVQIHGAEAARRLGLTTQVPTQPIFYTNGSSRYFKLGKLEIRLQHVASRKLALVNSIIGVVITALWYMGKKQVNNEIMMMIEKKLSTKEFEELRAAVSYMPAWMADMLHHYVQGKKHV